MLDYTINFSNIFMKRERIINAEWVCTDNAEFLKSTFNEVSTTVWVDPVFHRTVMVKVGSVVDNPWYLFLSVRQFHLTQIIFDVVDGKFIKRELDIK